MSQKFAIEKRLRDEDLESFRSLCAKPGKTYDDLQEWLGEHNYDISRGAVYNYRRNIEETLAHVREAAEMGRAIRENATAGGDIADGVSVQLVTAIQSKLIELQDGGIVESEEIRKLAMALRGSTGSRLNVVRLQREKAELEQQLADFKKNAEAGLQELQKKKGGAISDEDIAEARRKIFG